MAGKKGSRLPKSVSGEGVSKDRISGGSPDADLEYLTQMLKELRQIAERAGEGTLVYMIEMAALEAEETIRLRKLSSRLTG